MPIQSLIHQSLNITLNKGLIVIYDTLVGKMNFIIDIIQYFKDSQTPYYLLTPKGKTVKLLNKYLYDTDISEIPAQTIHSFLYSLSKDDTSTSEITIFDLSENKIEDNAIIIINEASLLSHEPNNDTDYLKFGSGYLLNDLLSYIDLKNSNRKLILIGDIYQLPPSNTNSSEIMNPDFWHKKDLSFEYILLSELYKQDKLSPLPHNIHLLREKIIQNDVINTPITTDRDEIISTTFDEAIKNYIWLSKKSMFIVYSNKQVYDVNMKFRELCHFSPNQLEKKESLALVKNAFINGKNYYQGDIFIVESVGNIESFSYIVKDVNIELEFIDVALIHQDSGQYITCKILNNKLWKEDCQPTKEELNALTMCFWERFPGFKNKRGTHEYHKLIRQDAYFNALFVRFGYATTCHKAQGTEWDNVFIDLSRPNDDLKTRGGFIWLYTALNTARNKVFLINLPKSRAFNPLNPFEYFILDIQKILIINGFNLTESKVNQYELLLFIEKDGITSNFKFYRNGKMKITKLMPIKETNYSLEIKEILTPFINISLVEE